MKIIGIGDIHGRLIWKDIINQENTFDKVIFIGDYFDTHDDVTAEQQIQNYLDIITYKEANPDKVELLIGNHDYHYFSFAPNKGDTTGYQYGAAPQIESILNHTFKHHKMCYLNNGHLFSHAGIGETWCKNNSIDTSPDKIEQDINDLWFYKPAQFKFTPGQNFSKTGNDITQTPIWIRPNSLFKTRVTGYKQIVGHTTQNRIAYDQDIYFIDVLGTSQEYLVIENGKASIKQIIL